MFEELVKLFKAKHEHTNVPPQTYADNRKLGIWVHTQRQGYRNDYKAGNKQTSNGMYEERINKKLEICR